MWQTETERQREAERGRERQRDRDTRETDQKRRRTRRESMRRFKGRTMGTNVSTDLPHNLTCAKVRTPRVQI